MADMKDFDVVQICRSDGADTGPGYWPLPTQMTPSTAKKLTKDAPATERAPRSKPQMIRLTEDDPRFVEWRVKLGILLKQELAPNPDEGNPWYVHFPERYWLYERSKHLWVSGYPTKAKLFKSPQEFALHLIWLLSASESYADCCCVHCNAPSPAKMASVIEDHMVIAHEESPKMDKIPPRVTPVPLPTIPGQPVVRQAVNISQPSSAQSTPPAMAQKPPTPVQANLQPLVQPPQQVHTQSQAQDQLEPQPQSQPVSRVQPQPQPQAQAQAQPQQPQAVSWSLKSALLFRVGELVWFRNGVSWRLGVIAAPVNGSYELLPIGHCIVPQQNVTKADSDMRPFHAFTVPPVGIPDLKDKRFDEAPWETMFRAASNEPSKRDMILEASKMAASKVDYSYSLYSPQSDDPNAKTVAYYGSFFGAERLEVGDCIRLSSLVDLGVPADNTIMGLKYIFTTKDYPGAVWFRGNIYKSVSGDVDLPNVVREENLPVALREESQWRNSVCPSKRWRWILLRENVSLKEKQIRGRFYPTHRIMPILNPDGFRAAVARGQVDDQYAHLNNRMDGWGEYVGRKRNRMDTLGASVPPSARLALEQHVREEGVGDVAMRTE